MDVVMFLFLSLMPTIEPRYAVAAATLSGWDPLVALSFGAFAVLILSGILVLALSITDKILLSLPLFGEVWKKYRARVRQKAGKYIDKWGVFGLILFVAIPLPGTGIYTGALAAYLFNMDLRRAWWALVAGGIISSVLTLVLALSGHVLLVTL